MTNDILIHNLTFHCRVFWGFILPEKTDEVTKKSYTHPFETQKFKRNLIIFVTKSTMTMHD